MVFWLFLSSWFLSNLFLSNWFHSSRFLSSSWFLVASFGLIFYPLLQLFRALNLFRQFFQSALGLKLLCCPHLVAFSSFLFETITHRLSGALSFSFNRAPSGRGTQQKFANCLTLGHLETGLYYPPYLQFY